MTKVIVGMVQVGFMYADLLSEFGLTGIYISLGLVLAPGFPDSASSLSHPYTNELVNSVIKAWAYTSVTRGFFSGSYYPNKEEIHCDYRKNLYVTTSVCRTVSHTPDAPFRSWFRNHLCFAKVVLGTQIMWLRGSQFHKFGIAEFKQVKYFHPSYPY